MARRILTVIRGAPIWVRLSFVLLLVLSGLMFLPVGQGSAELVRLSSPVMIVMGLLIGYQLRRQLALPGVRVIPDYAVPHVAVAFLGLLIGVAVVLVTGTWLHEIQVGGLCLWLGGLGMLALLAGRYLSGVVPLLFLSQYFTLTRSSWMGEALISRILNPAAVDVMFGLATDAALVFLILRSSQSIREPESARPRHPSDRAADVRSFFAGPDTRTFHRFSRLQDAGFIAQALHLRRSFPNGTLLTNVTAFCGILWFSRDSEGLFGILTLFCVITGLPTKGWTGWISALPFSRRSLVLRYGAGMALEMFKVILSFVIALLLMSQFQIRGFPPAPQLISAMALQVPLFGLKGLFLLVARDWTQQQMSAGIGALLGVLLVVAGILADAPLVAALLVYGVLGVLLLSVSYFSWCRADLR